MMPRPRQLPGLTSANQPTSHQPAYRVSTGRYGSAPVWCWQCCCWRRQAARWLRKSGQTKLHRSEPATGEFVKPPFAAFVVPGFPLGTDPLGRDILSQVLWAVRPTLILVLLVAALRLVLGTLIGLTAGWGHGRLSRLLESMTSLALIVPVFLVALCLIAAFSVEMGVWAFILGLCLTGWAETARIVHDQTRLTKIQPFVEAARALGSSDVSIVGRHVLPHIMPVIWILLPFEVSAALLVTAGLGFLGYFVNAIWVPLGDYTAMRASGQPELGQMLATGATMIRQQPWELLVAGVVVFVIVLGFNLLGEGLRLAFDPRRGRRRKGRLGLATERLANWMGDVGWQRVATLRASLPTIATLGALALLIVGGGIVLWQAREAQPSEVGHRGSRLTSVGRRPPRCPGYLLGNCKRAIDRRSGVDLRRQERFHGRTGGGSRWHTVPGRQRRNTVCLGPRRYGALAGQSAGRAGWRASAQRRGRDLRVG